MTKPELPVDAVELEIFRQLFASIAEEMGERLMRSAYSPNIKERRDYSCALFDACGDMIAQAAHIPVHLGSTPASVAAVLTAFPPDAMQPGDQFMLNDPFAGGTHLPDVTIVAPVFLPDAAPRPPVFFTANRAHHADVGGITPGSMPMSTHIDEEGVRLGPTRLTDAVIQQFAAATRTPVERLGDLQAQRAAAEAGVARIIELCRRHNLDIVTQRAADLQDYADRLVRAVIASIPDGRYRFTDHLDDDGFGAVDIAIRCELTIDRDQVIVDFSASDDQVRGPVNAVRAIAVSAVNYIFRCLGPSDMPSNAGVMRPIRVITRPGSIVDAQPPAAVAGGNVETSQRIVDALLGALAQAMPGRLPAASAGSMSNLTIGGEDPRRAGQPFAYYETIAGGAGAGPLRDGQSAVHTHMTNTLNTPIEALEHAYPFRVLRYAIRRGSGGAGRHVGGDGVIREYTFDTPVEVTLLTDRRTRQPWGVAAHHGSDGPVGCAADDDHVDHVEQVDHVDCDDRDDHASSPASPHVQSSDAVAMGAAAGATGRNTVIDVDGKVTQLPGKCTRRLDAGQCLRIETPGGGGWSA